MISTNNSMASRRQQSLFYCIHLQDTATGYLMSFFDIFIWIFFHALITGSVIVIN